MKKALVKYSKPKDMLSKARSVVKKGIKFTGIGAALGIGAYIAGAPSRRYKKAPKFGERNRDLKNQMIAQANRRSFYL